MTYFFDTASGEIFLLLFISYLYFLSWTTNIYTILADHYIQHFPFCQSAHIENWNFDVSHAIRHTVYKFHLLSLVFCRRTAVVILCRSVFFQIFHLLQHEKNILDGIKFGPVPIFGRRKRLEYTRADIFNSVWIVFSYNVRTLNAGPSVGGQYSWCPTSYNSYILRSTRCNNVP